MTRILLVEDTTELALRLQQELTMAGFEVEHARDGVEALERYARRPPDLVLLDWMLPRLDGTAVLRKIRQQAATPVIMLTARSEELDRVMGLEAGADDYITKPFSALELIARIKAMFRRIDLIEQTLKRDRHPEELDVLVYGALQLNTAAYRVTLEGTPIDLSRTEFNLLRLFLRNPGRTFSRAYLLDTIWEMDYGGGDRAVDNTVMRLRKKLGSVGERIEAVWGVGYRLHETP